MAGKKRPIRIEIPEELELTENEITSLSQAFMAQLANVQEPGDVEAVPFESINTTKLAVEIELIGPSRRKWTKKPPPKK